MPAAVTRPGPAPEGADRGITGITAPSRSVTLPTAVNDYDAGLAESSKGPAVTRNVQHGRPAGFGVPAVADDDWPSRQWVSNFEALLLELFSSVDVRHRGTWAGMGRMKGVHFPAGGGPQVSGIVSSLRQRQQAALAAIRWAFLIPAGEEP